MYIMPSLKHLQLLALCITIVAAFEGRPAASVVVSEEVPVPAGTEAVARALGIGTVPERGRFVAELTRLVFAVSRNNTSLAEVLLRLRHQPATELVPIPLTTALWSDAVFHRQVAPDDLLFAILSD